jgi:hypothetical protein
VGVRLPPLAFSEVRGRKAAAREGSLFDLMDFYYWPLPDGKPAEAFFAVIKYQGCFVLRRVKAWKHSKKREIIQREDFNVKVY